MSGGPAGTPGGSRRSTAVSGVLLALLLVGAAVVARVAGPDDGPTATSLPTTPAAPPASPAAPSPTVRPSPVPAADPPSPGPAYEVRRVGSLGDRTRIVSGQGDAEVRYARGPGQPTRLHFICTGCDADTWLVAWPRGVAVGGGPLAEPSDATAAVDADTPTARSSLVVKAPAGADWTLTLTPFDAVPLHRASFDGLDDDVVAVQARGDLALRCDGPATARTLARPAGQRDYALLETLRRDAGGTSALAVPAGVGQVVVVVSCSGRWTLTLP